MAPVAAIEYRKDIAGDRLYASRNHNQLRHTYDVGSGTGGSTSRAGIDWNITLRQVRKKNNTMKQAASAPTLTEHRPFRGGADRQEPATAEHADGPYHSRHDGGAETVGKYQNFAATGHMLNGLTRVASQDAFGVDFQLNLRDGYHGKPETKWRRFFTRPQATFDLMKENCSKDNEAYQKSHITPQDRRMDKWSGAISIGTIRDEPLHFKRQQGCEGGLTSQWRHLLEDRRHGHKARKQMSADTDLRYEKDWNHGAKICDNRSDGCIVEMLGKKKWVGHVSHEPLCQPPPIGDPKLYHLSRMRILAEKDEENRDKRKYKQTRKDGDIPYTHTQIPHAKATKEES